MKNYAQEAVRLKALVENQKLLEGSSKNLKDIVVYQEDFYEKLLQEKKELNSTVEILKDQIFEIQAEMFFLLKNFKFID